jgi:magnesium chelatase accessory protein
MRAATIPADWPHRSASRSIACAPHLWHVQEMGTGPLLLLLHGAGGASHSFRHLLPILARDYRVITLDLPGQGFTVSASRSRCGLEAMASDIATLATQENWAPLAIIGHSAGAALALRLAEMLPIKATIGINGALGGFDGVAGWLFPLMARAMSVLPLVPQVFSKLAGTPSQVHHLLTSTGSHIDPEGEAQYLRLIRTPSHVAATLAMMAQWDLGPLLARLPQQGCPCLLITSSADRAVPPEVSDRAAARLKTVQRLDIPHFGHLVHEEAAATVAEAIFVFLHRCLVSEGAKL